MAVTIRRLSGREVSPYLSELARLRIAVFREYPYLYEGDLEYEATYLRAYSQSPESVFVLAQDGEQIIGISTGLPLSQADAEFVAPFVEQGYTPETVFYFGESVLLSAYRGQGIGVRFFEEREAFVQARQRFRYCAFCAVARPEDHPARPANYQPLDQFWRNRGYTQYPQLKTLYPWRDLGESEETLKPMIFWIKSLG
ncbi:MAG: GNAT family N-acetyltransferase [Candidatus Competibacteraceae bacterium]|nr:GNAT family N-acetyltransferase [Candidatus Competibacteraceae bacterium]